MSLSPFHGIFSGFTPQQPVSPRKKGKKSDADDGFSQIPAPPQKQVGQIAVDIYEQDDYYIVRAPIAGVKLSDLDIEVDGKILTIRGTRSLSDEIPKNQYYLQECFWGEFSRSITLPCAIDPKRVKATFSKDGILKVIVPKEERVKIVRINEG